MTTYPETQYTDLTDFERQFAGEIELSVPAQDLLFRQARTASSFTDEPVTETQVRAIYDLAKWAPTSMNNQPLRIVLVRSDEARARLVDAMGDGNKAKTRSAPLVAVLAVDLEFHEELPKLFPHFAGARDMFASNDAMRAESATLNATLQVAYFLLAVRAAGLAAGPMTGFDADAVTRELFPGGQHRALVVMNIGHPGENAWFDRLPRLDYDEVVTTA